MIKTINASRLGKLGIIFALVFSLAIPTFVYGQGNGRNSDKRAEISAKIAERKAEAKLKIEERREGREQKSQEKRQQACERKLDRIDATMDRLSSQTLRHLLVIDSFFEKVQNFYDEGQLTVGNYDELKTEAEEAQENAQVEIEALSELNVEIDCEDPEVVVDVKAFKDSADAAKTALKDYRKALVALISSMRSAAAEDKSNKDDSSEDGETEEEPPEDEEPPEEETPDDNDPPVDDEDGSGDETTGDTN